MTAPRIACRLAAACLTLLLAQCANEEVARIASPSRITVSTRDATQAALLISQYRAQHGLGPVAPDNQLGSAAEYQARAVAETGTLSHGDFGGRMNGFRIGGYSAENLSAGSDTVAAAIARWKASPGHNENLLLPQARRIGLARADSPGIGYGHYWALVLAQ